MSRVESLLQKHFDRLYSRLDREREERKRADVDLQAKIAKVVILQIQPLLQEVSAPSNLL